MPETKQFNMRKTIITAFILTCINYTFGQKHSFMPEFKTSFHSFASSGDDLPFWFTSNQNGVFTMQNSTYQLLTAGFSRGLENDSLKNFGFTYGADMVYGYASESDFHLNQAWAGIRYKWFVLNAGMQADPVSYAGLSSTNGNIMWSNNARPLPGVGIASNGYMPFFFFKSWFSFKFEYEENFLNDSRYVEGAMLHHKNLFLRFKIPQTWQLTIGLDHWVYWGGTSPVYGKLPGFEDYLRYISGSSGSSDAPETDKLNVAGNSLGMYVIELQKGFENMDFTFYYNHPFEDHSGMEFANWEDGLWGIHASRKNRKAWLTDFVYEYMNTRDQSGSYHQIPNPDNPDDLIGRGRDNYFNHGVYRSGHTHYNRMMGTPLFIPVINEDGVAVGFESTRMQMHHVGLKGHIYEGFDWNSLFTWSKNYGTYHNPYPSPLTEFSFLTSVNYSGNKLPFIINSGIGVDIGNRFQKRAGGYLGIVYKF